MSVTTAGYDPGEYEPRAVPAERVALVDLLDRVLARGVVIQGDITLSIADVDLVTVSLRALITSVSTLYDSRPELSAGPPGGLEPGLWAPRAAASRPIRSRWNAAWSAWS